LRALLAKVLIQLGEDLVGQKRYTQAVVHLQRAASLWEELAPGEAAKWEHRMGRALTYFCLERAYDQQGFSDQAQQSFATAFELWRELQTEIPSATPAIDTPIDLLPNLSRILIPEDNSGQEVSLRFEEIRRRLDRMGRGAEGEWFLDVLRVMYLRVRMDTYLSARRSADLLAAAREAALVLARLLARASIHPNARWHVAANCLPVSRFLRRAKADEEALRLSEQANRALQELCREAPHH